MEQDQYFPADMILAQSSESKGVCYVETKNLDGETNLKHKTAEKYLNSKLQSAHDIETVLNGTLICEIPNDQIYKFEGTLYQPKTNKRLPMSSDNLLLRGSSLRNTEWVIGFVVYAGHQTKIMMNSTGARFKKSKIDRLTNK